MLDGLKRIRPCPGSIPLKSVAKGIVLIELITTVPLYFWEIYNIILEAPSPSVFSSTSAEASFASEDIPHTFQEAYKSFVLGFVCCAELWLSWTLWKGAVKENLSKLRRWRWISLTLLVIWVLIIIWSFVNGETAIGILDGFELVFALYSLWVVSVLIVEIQMQKSAAAASTTGRDEENRAELVDLDGISQGQLNV